jgi:hypothetical protein
MAKRCRSVTGMSFLLSVLGAAMQSPAQDSQPAAPVPTPKEMWERFQITLEPFEYAVVKDEVVASETDPSRKLRLVTFSFSSQLVPVKGDGDAWQLEKLWHDGVIFIPTDPALANDPERRGKVVVVGSLSGPYHQSFLSSYGDPIATRTGYPTMVVPNPGETRDQPGREYSQQWLMEYRRDKADVTYHSHFRWAVPFLRGLDVMAEVLGVEKRNVRAIIGGHSKRATGAYTAAGMDPERIAGVVYMGNESLHPEDASSKWWAVSPYYVQDFVRCPVFYVGATNEGGYAMFDINQLCAHMKAPWTLEYIPNYRHASECEKQFLAWQMWVAHIFSRRPLTRISDLRHEETETGTRFGVKIDSPNKLILAQIWYVYCDDPPYWRDLVWYPTLLHERSDGEYEGYVHGKMPDAWLVEVHDTAQGFRGYVSSLPQKLTDVPVERRDGRGMPRNWEEKQP